MSQCPNIAWQITSVTPASGGEPTPLSAVSVELDPAPPMISVVMPAHNEESYLENSAGGVVADLRAGPSAFEMIICENGSRDRTGEVAARLASLHPEVRHLTAAVADYGEAIRTGFLASRGSTVVNFDVDLVDMDFLRRAVEAIECPGGPAIVVGSKRGDGADDQRGLLRRAVTVAFLAVLRVGFGLRAGDTHGLKAMRREDLLPIVARCESRGEIFDTEMILRAERAGLAVASLPVTVIEQRPARTSITRRSARAVRGLARLRIRLWSESLRLSWASRLRSRANTV